jgi:hypothetical protein
VYMLCLKADILELTEEDGARLLNA